MKHSASQGVFFAVAFGAAVLALSSRRAEPVRLGAGGNASLDELRLERVSGGTWSLRQERGNVVLLNFWATWCPPCRKETPDLVKLHQRYSGQGFTVVGVSLDENARQAVPPFVERYAVPYPMLLAGESRLAASVEGLPTSLLIGRDGRVVETYVGAVTEENLRADIEKVLAARPKEGGD
jgi:thiol-disulfide isomerase/thioredoxin